MADLTQVLDLERPPEPRIDFGWIILNSSGHIWHDEIFPTPARARSFLSDSWPLGVPDGFTVVKGRKTVEVLCAPGFRALESSHDR